MKHLIFFIISTYTFSFSFSLSENSKNAKINIGSLEESTWQQVSQDQFLKTPTVEQSYSLKQIHNNFGFQSYASNNETISNVTSNSSNSSLNSNNSNMTLEQNATNTTQNNNNNLNESPTFENGSNGTNNASNSENASNSTSNNTSTYSNATNNKTHHNNSSFARNNASTVSSNISNHSNFGNFSKSDLEKLVKNMTMNINGTNITSFYNANVSNISATTNFTNATKTTNVQNVNANNISNNTNQTQNITSSNTPNMSNQTNNISSFQNPNPAINISKLENITDNIKSLFKPPNNPYSDYKDYLVVLNYSSKGPNVSVSKVEESIFPRIDTLRSVIRSSLAVDSLNERSKLRKSITESEPLSQLLLNLDNYNNCSNLSNCSSCVADSGCGWCPTLRLCIIGNDEGPYLGRCPFYQFGLCSGKNCLRYTDCDSCLKDEECGWCQNEEKGFSKCVEGKEFFTGCPSDSWLHSLKTSARLNSCKIVFGPSEDQLERKEQKRTWEKNQITRMQKLKLKGREIREELGNIPSYKQSQEYLQKIREKRKRLEKVESLVDSFDSGKKFHLK